MSLLSDPHSQVDGLVERERELAALDAAFVEASAGRGRVVLVTAEAGGGKTALIDRFCAGLASPTRVLRGACDALFTPRPLGPIYDVAADAGRELNETLQGEAIPYQVATALIDELRQHEPTVLVVDDVHWADEATLDVLRLVARRIGSTRVLVVLSYRDEALSARHPVRVMLGDVASGLAPIRLALEPLSAEAVARVAEPYGVDSHELFRVTGGNPFFVTEVVASGNDSIPPTVRDAVLARAARLTDEARALLDAVAIDPSHVELWLLEALAGEHVSALEKCLTSGMLVERAGTLEFRHELARLAIEQSLGPRHRVALHRCALTALAEPPIGQPDLSRLAHHSEAAGDPAAVMEYAPAAAEQASSVGAHREAEAQYARALRFGTDIPADVRADLLERFAAEGYLTEMRGPAIESLQEALAIHRERGDLLKQGDTLRLLSRLYVCVGRTAEARTAAVDAVAILEQIPQGPELARAYSALTAFSMVASDLDETLAQGTRAIELAERVGDTEALVNALNSVGVVEVDYGIPGGWERIERSLELSLEAELANDVGRAYLNLAALSTVHNNWARADAYIPPGIEYCRENGLEAWLNFLVGARAESELAQGRWTAATDTAKEILDLPPSDIRGLREGALLVLGLVRARRGDPEYWPLLDEALSLVGADGVLQAVTPVVVARAEALWLEGKSDEIGAETQAAYELALETGQPHFLGQLAVWRRRAAVGDEVPVEAAEPYRLELMGNWGPAAERWRELNCPYAAALSLADAGEEGPLREALDQLQRLEARPAAAIVARRLRELGVRGVARGPRPSTAANPAALTAREIDVLRLLADGLRNATIGERLFLSPRTVEHHVSAILSKLGVQSRGEAVAEAGRLGLLQDP